MKVMKDEFFKKPPEVKPPPRPIPPKPEGVPPWFDWNNGFGVEKPPEIDYPFLGLKNCRSSLSLSPAGDSGWFLKYHSRLSESSSISGTMILSGDELRQAFAVSKADSLSYEAEVPGFFVRKDNFLNIPARGTGKNTDPNVSVFLTPELKDAVRALAC